MENEKKNPGLVGAAFIGVGCGLAAIGIALVIPSIANWSLSFAEQALKKSKEGAANVAGTLGEMAGRAHHHFGEAAKTAKAHTASAAEKIESTVHEYAS